MFSASLMKKSVMQVMLLLLAFVMSGCDGVGDDLFPSSSDKRPVVDTNIMGTQVGQQSPDFAMFDTLGNSRGLYAELDVPRDGVVLYFNMWCPICDAHASHMRANVIPLFPNISFFLVDYVSGAITVSLDAQLANGYGDMETLVDTDQLVFDKYDASMGTTVVIGNDRVVRMNEDYKDGVKLTEVLQALP